MDNKERLEADEHSSTEQKTWQVSCIGKRNVLRSDLNLKESREVFYQRGKGRSFHVEESDQFSN